MRKVLCFILILTLFNFKNVNSTELSDFLKLPEVINQSLDTSLEGNDKLYPVEIDGLYGFIDVNGKIVIEPMFAEYEVYSSDFYLGYTHKEHSNTEGDDLRDPTNGTYLVTRYKVIKIVDGAALPVLTVNKKYAFVHYYDSNPKNGDILNNSFIFDFDKEKIIDKCKGTYEIVNVFNDGYIVNENGLYYIKDFNKQKLTSGYSFFYGFDDDLLVFLTNDESLHWLDKNGNIVFKYNSTCKEGFFHKDIAVILDKEDNLMFMDKDNNNLKTYTGFQRIARKADFYLAQYSDTTYIIFDYKGNKKMTLYNKSFDYYQFNRPFYASRYDRNGFFEFYDDKKGIYSIFDENGDIKNSYKIPDGYRAVNSLNDFIVLEGKKGYGICKINDKKIEWILEPKYYYIRPESCFFTVTNEYRNQGLFHPTTKKFILEPKYKYINVYDENMVYVRSAYFDGYVNSKGEFVYARSSFDFGGD